MKQHSKQQIAAGMKHLAATVALLLGVTSCGMMEDDLSDCPQELRVDFKYDMNMKFADALSHEVKTITLYAYDHNGRLALEKQDRVADIINRGGYMTVNELMPGDYTLKVWAEGDVRYADSYIFGRPETRAGEISVLTSRINRSERTVNHDITSLYHGLNATADLNLKGYGVKTASVDLTKDTNVIRVVLQNASGKRLNADDFDFFIDDDNSFLAYDNTPLTRSNFAKESGISPAPDALPEDSITYRPWSVYDGIVGSDHKIKAHSGASTTRADGDTETKMSAVVAEFTVNRLFMEKHPRLRVVNRSDGKTVFNIPMKDYILLVKGNYNHQMTDQEYLDREDTYDFVFFIDDNHTWLSASIYINSWRVVLQSSEL